MILIACAILLPIVSGIGMGVLFHRYHTENLVRRREARLRRLAESMLDVIMETDASDHLVYISPSARVVFGYEPESLLGQSLFTAEMVHPEDLECVKAEIAAIHHAGEEGGAHQWKQEYRIRHADGHYVWVESHTRFVFDEASNFVTAVTTTRDIGTRKQVEETLRHSEEKYRRLFENTLAGIYRTTLKDGKVVEANAALREMTGYTEIEGVDASQLYADPLERQAMIAQLIEKGEVRNFETIFRRKDGTIFWGSLSASLYQAEDYLEGVLIDISERKRAEAELEQSLSVLQATLESTQDGILAVDVVGRPINYNRQFLEMWQQSDDVMSASEQIDRIAHLADKTIDPEGFLRRLQEIYQQPDLESYDVIHLKDGRIFERYGKAQRLGNRIVGRVWNLRDITRRRQAEEALQRSLSENQQATSRLTAIVAELERRAQEATLLNKMGDMLQTCNSPEEVYAVVERIAPQLFPHEAGTLAIQNENRTLVEVVAQWGQPDLREEVFSTEMCWALRRGQMHIEENSQGRPLCRRMLTRPSLNYLCVPLMAHGESLGILHVQSDPAQNGKNGQRGESAPLLTESRQQLTINIAERVALSLSNIRLRDSLQRQAIHDPLTGLFNRRYMNEALDHEIRRARRRRQPLSIIMLDIDHFKNYNDTYGHQAGDLLLQEMALFLQSNVRAEDIICRYGGEEFTVILPGATLEDAIRRSEQIWEGVKCLEVEYHGRILPSVTLSLGVTELNDSHGNAIEALLRDADDALYQAKASGRNRVMVAGR